MIFYCLNIAPDEYGIEGEDLDEWFTSLNAAKHRRQELIDGAGSEQAPGEDLSIDAIVVRSDLPPKQLLLNVLNRKAWMKSLTRVVPPHCFPQRQSSEG